MKTLLTLLLIGAALTLRAQVITYDYAARTYVTLDKATNKYVPVLDSSEVFLPYGTNSSYILININPFAQRILINSKLYSISTPIPAQLLAVFSIKLEAAKELTNTDEQIKEMVDVEKNAGTVRVLKLEMDTLVSECRDYYKKARKIDDALFVKERLIGTMGDKRFYDAVSMTAALVNRKINLAMMDTLEANFEAFDKAYDRVAVRYLKAIKTAHDANEKDKEARISTALNQVDRSYRELEKKYKNTLADIGQLFANAIDSTSYVVKSLPVKLMGKAGDADEVEYEVNIDDQQFVDPFPVKGGWKLDYSVGPVANFVADEQFFFEVSGDKNTLRQRDKGGLFNTITPTVSSMMHVFKRKHTGFAIGGLFGINAGFKEFTDIKLGFLAGASAIIGRSQKVFVSTGVSYLPINRLKEGQFVTGTSYPGVKIDDVTDRALRPSWFLAISLGITKRSVIKPTVP
ncbi:hypothetical protein J2I47_12810 [Fibrella sp. HMF5335]|uniref:Outer membrane protein beta-barrel domain-containing protein n=1 Tax=Fibrella rubiginis TaxID=2817060 RepID=A0A939GED3_9BACT|nr:hypothetical protein [Fibrella rubiginis]MBO0937429.1 hypothetical protein [Fibrella rubiginis]